MAWLKVDDQFAENPKVADLTDRSFRLHVVALCYCARNLTDGYLDERAVRVVSAIVTRSSVRRNIAELVAAGLWIEHYGRGGFVICDYLDYNPTAAEVKEKREKRASAGRLGGLRSGQARAEANASSSAKAVGEAWGLNPGPSPSPKDQVLYGAA